MKVVLSALLLTGGIIGLFPACIYLFMASAFAGFGNSEVPQALGCVILCAACVLIGWLVKKSIPVTSEVDFIAGLERPPVEKQMSVGLKAADDELKKRANNGEL